MLHRLATLFGIIMAVTGCRAQAPQTTQASPGLKIAMIAKSSTNPVFLSARTGAEAAAKELSGKHGVPVEIVWLTPEGSEMTETEWNQHFARCLGVYLAGAAIERSDKRGRPGTDRGRTADRSAGPAQ